MCSRWCWVILIAARVLITRYRRFVSTSIVLSSEGFARTANHPLSYQLGIQMLK